MHHQVFFTSSGRANRGREKEEKTPPQPPQPQQQPVKICDVLLLASRDWAVELPPQKICEVLLRKVCGNIS